MSKMSNSGGGSGSLSDAMVKIPRIRLKKQQSNNQNKIGGTADHIRVQSSRAPVSQQEALCHALHQSKQFHNMSERERGVPAFKGSSDEEEIHVHQTKIATSMPMSMIKPKKIPNPIKESIAMQNIHKELLLNQKIGRSVLTHKSELQRALEKLASKQVLSESPTSPEPDGCESPDSLAPNPPPMPFNKQNRQGCPLTSANNNKNEFQRILDARAKLIEEQKCFVDGETKPDVPKESEFEKIHKKITHHAS